MLPYPYSFDYKPPESFLKRVRSEVDRNIFIWWNSVSKKWAIFYKNPETSEMYLIFTAKELDQRIIYRLQIGDSRKWPSAKEKHRELLAREEKYEKEKENKIEEERKYKIKQDLTRWSYAASNAMQGNFG